MTRVAGYRRVSTDGQIEAFGLPVQSDMLDAGARRLGLDLTSVLTDGGESGSNGIETRLALFDALGLISTGEVDGLLVPRLDRLARDVVVQEQLIADVRRRGGQVWSCDSAEDNVLRGDDVEPSRKMVRVILGSVAEYEKSMIRLRLQAGRDRKRAGGGYAGHGAPPFGWKAVEGSLVPVPGQQDVISRIRELSASGLTLREISAHLADEGLPGPRSPRWTPEAVRRVLKRL